MGDPIFSKTWVTYVLDAAMIYYEEMSASTRIIEGIRAAFGCQNHSPGGVIGDPVSDIVQEIRKWDLENGIRS